MAARTYICTVSSWTTTDRNYTVRTRSAMKCSEKYGRCEDGEQITVRTYSGKILSRVIYYAGIGYTNVNF